MHKLFFLTLLICLTALKLSAQDDNPKYHIDEDGKLYWNKKMPVYLFIGTTPDKADVKLESESTPQYANPHYFDTEGINYIRSKDAFDIETGQIVEPRVEVKYEIYADGIDPQTNISLSGAPSYTSNGTTYFGKGLILELSASDAISGVEFTKIKINKSDFDTYSSAINIPDQGEYNVEYFSSDYTGNAEDVQSISYIVDTDAPVSNLNVNGLMDENVISASSKLYILTNDNLSGVKRVYYKFDEEEFKVYNNEALNFKYLEDGEHKLTYYAIDQVDNTEEQKVFNFYFDKSAPLMAADVLGDRFVVDDQVYFSGRTKMKLTAVDNKVGVKEIRYSIDNEEYQKYENPFYLPSISGDHIIRYYSIDNMNNQSGGDASGFEEYKHSVSKVYVDLTGPTLSHEIKNASLTRKDTLLIGPLNRIILKASDSESGLKNVTYSLDKATAETDYSDPIRIVDEGFHQLEYFGYDNVNNRNVSSFYFNVDATPPSIFFQFSVGDIDESNGVKTYPSSVGVFVAATDTKAGLQSIYYSINGQAEKQYRGMISGLRPDAEHTIKVRTLDNLGNESTDEITFRVAP